MTSETTGNPSKQRSQNNSKRSKPAIIINVLRSLTVNSVIILLLPAILGSRIIWFTFEIYEALILVVAVILLRNSEINNIVHQWQKLSVAHV